MHLEELNIHVHLHYSIMVDSGKVIRSAVLDGVVEVMSSNPHGL